MPGGERIQSVSTGVSDGVSEGASFATNGFEGAKRGTDFWLSADVTARDPDGRRPEASAASGSRFFAALEPAEAVGRRAAERALSRIGATRGESGVLPMVVEARAAGRLVGQLLGPLHGAALQQRRSFLEGRMGQPIGSPLLDLRDDPLVPRGFGSRLFDGEGLAARPRPVVERGVLASWYLDTYYGRKLGLPPTTGRPSNLLWRCGTRSRDALLAEVGEGVLVSGFLGGNSNGTTGDFSLGVRGFRIRRGQLAEPVGGDERLRQPPRALAPPGGGRRRPVPIFDAADADAGVRRGPLLGRLTAPGLPRRRPAGAWRGGARFPYEFARGSHPRHRRRLGHPGGRRRGARVRRVRGRHGPRGAGGAGPVPELPAHADPARPDDARDERLGVPARAAGGSADLPPSRWWW